MKVARLASIPLEPLRSRMRQERYIPTVDVTPAWIGAFSALKLSRTVRREKASVIEVTRVDDIMAAISARELLAPGNAKGDISGRELLALGNAKGNISGRGLSTRGGVKIAVNLPPLSPTPSSLPREFFEKTDLWIFPSERMRDEFARLGNLRRTAVVPPACFDYQPEDIARADNADSDSPTTNGPDSGSPNDCSLECDNSDTNRTDSGSAKDGNTPPGSTGKERTATLVMLLPRKADTRQVIAAIDAVDSLGEEVAIHFLGESEAASIMPAIRHARNIDHPERIVWRGTNYDLPTLLCEARALVQAGADLTEAECAAYLFGCPVICPEGISTSADIVLSPEEAAVHTPQNHIDLLARALIEI